MGVFRNSISSSSSSNIDLSRGLDMKGKKIINLADPDKSQDGDVVNVKFVKQNYLDKIAGGTMLGSINMSHNKITNVDDPSSDKDAVNMEYVVDRCVMKDAPTRTIDVDNYRITNVPLPVGDDDATNRRYVHDNYLQITQTQANMNGAALKNLATPLDDNDATTKRYVDDKFHSKLVNIDMNGKKIVDLPTPTDDTDAANKKYVDDADTISKKYVDDNFYKLDNYLNMNKKRIGDLGDPIGIKDAIHQDHIRKILSETLFWEMNQHATSVYDLSTESYVTINNTRKVSKIEDIALVDNDASVDPANPGLSPIMCDKDERINNRYYLKFGTVTGEKNRMLSQINLNSTDPKNDKVNVFIVYKTRAVDTSYWTANGLFGHDDGGFDKFVSFSNNTNGNLVISGYKNQWFHIGSQTYRSFAPRAGYKTKANAGEFHKWICLSIHWIDETQNASSVWCNGQKLTNFTSKKRTGSTQMTFGDLNPTGIAHFQGDIGFFSLHKDKTLSADDIRLQHYVLCKRYSIDTIDFM